MRKLGWILPCLFVMLVSSSLSSSAQAIDISKFDEFGDINCESEKARLDDFAVQLQSKPDSVGYITVYGGNYRRRGEAQARASRIKAYLTKSRGLDLARVKTIDGGYMEKLTVDLWIVPSNLPAPLATPTIQAKNVRFKKGRIKKREYDVCEP